MRGPPHDGGVGNTLLIQDLSEINPDAIVLDGLSVALVGSGRQRGSKEYVAVYDGHKIIACLIDTGMTHETATEYMSFNIECAYMGKNTPIIMWTESGL